MGLGFRVLGLGFRGTIIGVIQGLLQGSLPPFPTKHQTIHVSGSSASAGLLHAVCLPALYRKGPCTQIEYRVPLKGSIWVLQGLGYKGPWNPNSIYVGLQVVPTQVLRGHIICYLGTWTLGAYAPRSVATHETDGNAGFRVLHCGLLASRMPKARS